jgi:phage shock protein C
LLRDGLPEWLKPWIWQAEQRKITLRKLANGFAEKELMQPISGGELMHCNRCSTEIADSANFCPACGSRQQSRTSHKQLMLSIRDKKIAGVCGGIAEYLDVDATIVRLIWVALSIVPGGFVGGIVAYVLAWAIIPKTPAFVPVPVDGSLK